MRRAGRATTAVGLAAVATLAAGCTGTDSPGPSAQATAQSTALAFLEAQADGRYGDAVDLSTASRDTLECSWLVSEVRDGSLVSPAVPSSAESSADGEVTVDVSYSRGGAEIVTSLGLVGGDGQWRVTWPDGYRLEAAFAEPAVAELRVDPPTRVELSDPSHDVCSVRAEDGLMRLHAFPDSYVATVVDPTGVMDYSLATNAVLPGDEPLTWDLGPAVPEDQLVSLQLDFADARQASRVTCDGGLCGEDLVGSDGLVRPGEFTRVWTEDGESWSGAVSIGGRDFTAALARSAGGELSVDLGPVG
ncbi:MAG: hypothetical protein ACK4MD_11390 [Demequina sp.]